jgi:hypothetical protein
VSDRGLSTPAALRQLLDTGAIEDAKEILRRTTAARLQQPGEHREWGLLAERLGLVGIAEREFNLALRDDPRDRVALDHLVELALESGAFERAANLLERLLDLDPHAAEVAGRLHAIYLDMGATPRAEALRQRMAAAGMEFPGGEEVSLGEEEPSGEPVIPADADLVRFLALFGGREDVYARQWFSPSKGEGGYSPVREPLTVRQVRQHFLGDVTLGVYPIRLDGTCVFCALDLDLRRDALAEASRRRELARLVRGELRDTTRAVTRTLAEAGLPHLVEDSGYKGRHFWFFLEAPERADTLVALGKAVLHLVAPHLGPHLAVEWFPKASRPGSKGLGNLIKLPLGLHRRTGRRSCFLDGEGNPVLRPFETLRTVPKLSRASILAVIDAARAHVGTPTEEQPSEGEAPPLPAALPPPPLAMPVQPGWTAVDFDRTPAFARLLARCPVLAALRHKAEEERRLSHDEIVVLQHTLGHLPSGVAAVNYLLARCLAVPPNAFLKSTLRGNPVSCPKIRARLSHITSRVPCACEFPEDPDAYPTPLLHLRGLEPADLTAPPPETPPEDVVRRLLLLRHRRLEIEAEIAQVEHGLLALLRARAQPYWELPEGSLRLVERDGVAELLWTARESKDEQDGRDH